MFEFFFLSFFFLIRKEANLSSFFWTIFVPLVFFPQISRLVVFFLQCQRYFFFFLTIFMARQALERRRYPEGSYFRDLLPIHVYIDEAQLVYVCVRTAVASGGGHRDKTLETGETRV